MEFRLDGKSGVPFYRQIIEQVKFGMARGDLQPGDQLPTVRQLAVDLTVHHNTVAEAYRILAAEGWLDLRQGRGAIINSSREIIFAWRGQPGGEAFLQAAPSP